MGNEAMANKRLSPRHPLKIDLSAYLFAGPERKPVKCLGVDVGFEGLGVVTFEERQEGELMELVLGSKSFSMRVIWCRADTSKKGVFHVGLVCTRQKVDLTREFRAAGLLQIVKSWTFRDVSRK